MQRIIYKTAVLTAGVIFALIAGCETENASKSETKKWRLTAAENRQLEKEAENLSKEVEKTKELLAKSMEEKDEAGRIKDLLKAAAEEKSELQQTNEELHAQIGQLEKELEKMRGTKKYKAMEQEMTETAMRDLEEIVRLREENEKLQAEIADLKKN